MLGESRDVLVARDRVAGAAMIAADGNHDVILMDDGLQHPYIAKDFAIGVFDGNVGIGNGWLIPAGPLRIGLRGVVPLPAVAPAASVAGVAAAGRRRRMVMVMSSERPSFSIHSRYARAHTAWSLNRSIRANSPPDTLRSQR